MALLACLVSACSSAPVPKPTAHPTIVSLNPCSDAVLAEVAGPEQILALSHYSSDPASTSMDLDLARRFRSVTGSAEEIAALRPDIVVADNFLPPSTRSALDELGIRVVAFPIARSVSESREQVAELAAIAGHPERGEELNARVDAALAGAAPAASAHRPTALIWQAGGIVPGPDTLVADLLGRTGFINYGKTRGMEQADYLPLEAVIADPPDLVLAAGDPASSENRLLAHPALSALNGTRRAAFDPRLLWCGGPTIIRAAERLAHVRDGAVSQ